MALRSVFDGKEELFKLPIVLLRYKQRLEKKNLSNTGRHLNRGELGQQQTQWQQGDAYIERILCRFCSRPTVKGYKPDRLEDKREETNLKQQIQLDDHYDKEEHAFLEKMAE